MSKLFFIVFILFFDQSQLWSKPKIANDTIHSVRVYSNFPGVSPKGKLLNMYDSLTIFYYKEMVLYQIPTVHLITNTYLNKFGNTVKNTTKEEPAFEYFVYKQGDDSGFSGLLYDTLTVSAFKKRRLDSFLVNEALRNPVAFNNLDEVLIEHKLSKGYYSLIEKSAPKKKIDETYEDTSYFYFSDRLKDIDFSFSPKMDSLKNSKLVKIRFLYNATYSKKYKIRLPRREMFFEIRQVPVINRKEIIDLIEECKKLNNTGS